MLHRLAACAVAAFLASSAMADATASSNRLMVGAAQLFEAAQNEPSLERRTELLRQAQRKLEEIIKQFPSSDLAVKLITGQPVGYISLSAIRKQARDTGEKLIAIRTEAKRRKESCIASPTYSCLIDQSLAVSEKITHEPSRDTVLRTIATVQANAGAFEDALVTTATITAQSSKSHVLRHIGVLQAKSGDFDAALATTAAISGKAVVLNEISIVQARAGNFDGARGTIKTIENAADRVRSLINLADIQAEIGDSRAAKIILLDAIELAKMLDTSFVSPTLWPSMKAIGGAQRLYGRPVAFWEISISLSRIGHFEDALSTVQLIQDPYWKNKALQDLVNDREKAYDFENALRILALLTETNTGDRRLEIEAISQAHSGNFDAAIAKASTINNLHKMISSFARIAVLQARSGDIASAQSAFRSAILMIRKISDISGKVRALRNVAVAQAESGDLDGARNTFDAAVKTAVSLGDSKKSADFNDIISRPERLSAIAGERARIGDIVGALSTATLIEANVLKAESFVRIGTTQLKAGDANGARQTLKAAHATVMTSEENDGSRKMWMLVEIAGALHEAGDPSNARAVLKDARAIGKRDSGLFGGDHALSSILTKQVEIGDIRGALDTVEIMDAAAPVAKGLSRIASALGRPR